MLAYGLYSLAAYGAYKFLWKKQSKTTIKLTFIKKNILDLDKYSSDKIYPNMSYNSDDKSIHHNMDRDIIKNNDNKWNSAINMVQNLIYNNSNIINILKLQGNIKLLTVKKSIDNNNKILDLFIDISHIDSISWDFSSLESDFSKVCYIVSTITKHE